MTSTLLWTLLLSRRVKEWINKSAIAVDKKDLERRDKRLSWANAFCPSKVP